MKREERQAWLDAVKLLPKKEELRLAWVKWIEQYKPDLYVTITFGDKGSPALLERKFALEKRDELVIRSLKQYLKNLNQRRFEFYEKFLFCWILVEPNPKRKGVHIHALIKGIVPELSGRLEARLNDAFGESKVVPFDYSIQPYSAIDYIVDKYVFYHCDNLMLYRVNSKYRGGDDGGGGLVGADNALNPPLYQPALA